MNNDDMDEGFSLNSLFLKYLFLFGSERSFELGG